MLNNFITIVTSRWYEMKQLSESLSVSDLLYLDLRREGHYKMMCNVCVSVRPAVACLDLTRERKGLGSSKLAAYHMGNPSTYLEVKRSKVKVTRPINAVTNNASYALQLKLLIYF